MAPPDSSPTRVAVVLDDMYLPYYNCWRVPIAVSSVGLEEYPVMFSFLAGKTEQDTES